MEAVDPRERTGSNIANAVGRGQGCDVKEQAGGAVTGGNGERSGSLTIAHTVFPQDAVPDRFGLAYGTGHGSTFQMPAAYSEIVRSLENFPEPATFRMAFCAQALGSAYNVASRSCAWT